MTKNQQKQFVRDLFKSMQRAILEQIEQGKIPGEWDGVELRYLIAKRADDNATFGDKKRKKEFNNIVIINNL